MRVPLCSSHASPCSIKGAPGLTLVPPCLTKKAACLTFALTFLTTEPPCLIREPQFQNVRKSLYLSVFRAFPAQTQPAQNPFLHYQCPFSAPGFRT